MSRGFASETYAHSAAHSIVEDGRDCFIYEFGDHDPSGVAASAALKRKLINFVGESCRVEFVRAAVTLEQIENLRLPSRPTKREGNRHAKEFAGDSVELDAIPPDRLRDLVRDCIEKHVDRRALAATMAAERSEREYLHDIAKAMEARA